MNKSIRILLSLAVLVFASTVCASIPKTGKDFSTPWDAENRLIAVASNGTPIASYQYDSENRRVSKTVGDTTHQYTYDGWNVVAEKITNPSSSILNLYVWGPDINGSLSADSGGVRGLLCILSSDNGQQPTAYYPVMNNHGDVTALFDASGTSIVAKYERDPWGVLLSASGPAAGVCPFGFQTKYYDAETGLYYINHRYYSPTLGRWMSRDPIAERGGYNFYSFCNGNPFGVDAKGLEMGEQPQGQAWQNIVVPYEFSHYYYGTTWWESGMAGFANMGSLINNTAWGTLKAGTEVFAANPNDSLTPIMASTMTGPLVGFSERVVAVANEARLAVLATPVGQRVAQQTTRAVASVGQQMGTFFNWATEMAGEVRAAFTPGASGMRADSRAGFVDFNSSTEARNLVRPSLPELKGSFAEAFDGPPKIRTFKTGERVYRSPNMLEESLEPAEKPGPWLSTRRTVTKAGTESQSNVIKWGNPLSELRTYEFTEDVTVYYGKVFGGKGFQIMIPRDVRPSDILRCVEKETLK